jgi:hypothetical protein
VVQWRPLRIVFPTNAFSEAQVAGGGQSEARAQLPSPLGLDGGGEASEAGTELASTAGSGSAISADAVAAEVTVGTELAALSAPAAATAVDIGVGPGAGLSVPLPCTHATDKVSAAVAASEEAMRFTIAR